MALEDKLLGRLKGAINLDNNMEEVALLASLHMVVLHQVHHMDLLKVVVMDSQWPGVQHQGDPEVLMEAMLLGDLMVYQHPILMELLNKASMDKLLQGIYHKALTQKLIPGSRLWTLTGVGT